VNILSQNGWTCVRAHLPVWPAALKEPPSPAVPTRADEPPVACRTAPKTPISDLLRPRFCAIGAIMRAGRELGLPTKDACIALVEDWNDDPARTHAEVIATFDAAVVALKGAA